MGSDGDWKRLGNAVVSRRVALGWKTREEFASKIDLSYRSLSDLENGKRPFAASTLAMVEQALEWEPGSAASILDGGKPLTAAESFLASDPAMQDHPSRAPFLPIPQEIARDDMITLLDRARRVYADMIDLREGGRPDILRGTADLHAAALKVVFAWAGGRDKLDPVLWTYRDLEEGTPRDPDAALELLKEIRDAGKG